jgi:hypothetical protein
MARFSFAHLILGGFLVVAAAGPCSAQRAMPARSSLYADVSGTPSSGGAAGQADAPTPTVTPTGHAGVNGTTANGAAANPAVTEDCAWTVTGFYRELEGLPRAPCPAHR